MTDHSTSGERQPGTPDTFVGPERFREVMAPTVDMIRDLTSALFGVAKRHGNRPWVPSVAIDRSLKRRRASGSSPAGTARSETRTASEASLFSQRATTCGASRTYSIAAERRCLGTSF